MRARLLQQLWLVSCLTAMLILVTGCGPSVVELDNEQGHLDQAAPLIGEHTVGQTFVSHYPRLTAVEVLLVVYDEPQPAPSRRLTFHLLTSPYSQQDLVTLNVDTASLKHNDPYRFTFPPQPDSEGRAYFFLLEASEGNKVTVWQSSRNAYGEGTLIVDGQPTPGDLLFKTYYDFDVGASLTYLGRGLLSHLGMALVLLAMLLAPGYVLHSLLLPEVEMEPLEHVAVAVGLSLALIPLATLGVTTLGLRLTAFWIRAAVVVAVALSLWRLLASRRLAGGGRGNADGVSNGPKLSRAAIGAFGVIFTLTLALRFLHTRTLVIPAWVDSVHHTMTVQLIMEAGGVPGSFRPFMPIDYFFLHFGFQAMAAAVAWLTGLDAPTAVLVLGQVLNALMALSMALLTSHLTRRVWAGVIAALVVGTVSLMPAFYVSWGRYTQLTGLVLLPTALVLTIDALRPALSRELDGEPSALRRVLLASVAVAGLFLTHYRVTIFFAAFVIAHVLVATWSGRRSPGRVRTIWVQAIEVAVLTAVFVLPWLINVASIWASGAIFGGRWQGTASYNAVPRELLWVGKNRALALLAGLGLAWGLLRRAHGVITLCLTCVLLVAIANPAIFGLANPWLLNNAALVIAFFVPLSFGVGCLGGWAIGKIRSWLPQRWHGAYAWAVATAVTALAFWTATDMLTVVNPVTILATRDDLAAMAWIRDNVPPDAKFLVNARRWQEGAYMGTDGGYWIPLLTGRATTLPPALYFYGAPEYFTHVHAVADVVATVTSADDASLRRVIEEEGVTHVYLGARGGALRPEFFLDDPRYHVLYSTGSVWIFSVANNSHTSG